MVNRRRWVPQSHFRLSPKDHQRPPHQRASAHHSTILQPGQQRQSPDLSLLPHDPSDWHKEMSHLWSSYLAPFIVNRSEQSQIRNPESIFENARLAEILPVTVTISVTNQEISTIICSRDTNQFFGNLSFASLP